MLITLGTDCHVATLLAMTRKNQARLKKWLIPNKLVGLKKYIVGNSARDFFARQTAEPKEYFVYFEALVCSIAEKDPLKGNEGFQKFHLKKKGAGRIAIRPAQTPI